MGQYRILYAVLTATASEFVMGLWAGWPSWALTKRPTVDTPAEWMTREDHAWTVAAFDLANVLLAWPAGILANRIGRRGCLIVIGLSLASSFGVLFAPGRWALFAARTLAGAAKAIALCTTPAFLAEISTNEARGKVNVMAAVFDALGMLVAMLAGPRCPYALMNGLSLAMAIAFLVAMLRVPETPTFLLTRGRDADARASNQWYRPDVTAENRDEDMARLSRSVREDMSSPGTFRELFTDHGNQVALALVLGSIVAQRAGGITCVFAYTTSTLSASGPIDPHNVAATFAVVRLVFTVAALPLVDRYGRRPLLIGSHACCTIVSLAYSYSLYADDGTAMFGWAMCACVVLFVVVYSVGAGAVPGALLGEMFPSNVKSHAVTVINVSSSFASFASTRAYLPITDAVGAYATFIAFAVINAVWAVIAFLFLFETNGMSLADIQDVLNNYGKKPAEPAAAAAAVA